ncbi:MAG: F0F1 ATP synthase subunit epsilon [Acholeplasmataceae bacterium]
MIFKVLTQLGETHQDTIEYAVVKNADGEMAILKDHIPIILHVAEGYLKFVQEKQEIFLVVEQAVVEFKNNELTILALEAQIGKTLENAKEAFENMKKEKLELTKQENVDFSKLEKDLKENIKKSRAGHLS